ncbi:MAG: GDP-mannose 4,6-dehydratase [Burkholderiales bacterium]|nr:GDP-mannose 4,6-dehydratase [Burkholderiales bacterium]
MKNKLLLVGGTGFVGSHIALAAGSSFDVVASGRECDVRNADSVAALIARERPDGVVHLAAITTLAESFENPREALDVNFGGVLNVLTALQESGFRGGMLFVSSSEVYGPLFEGDLPVSEERVLKPASPYAVGKIAAEALCHQWSRTANFRIVSTRPFNHIGPGQSVRFAISDFARQVVAIRLGLAEPVIHVGDIDTTRDFTDVRDVVQAYLLLLERGRNGEVYNVCSGIERSIRSMIQRMCEIAGVDVELRSDSARIRPNDQRRVRGDHAKMSADTGWQPAIPIDRTLSDLLDFWSEKLND